MTTRRSPLDERPLISVAGACIVLFATLGMFGLAYAFVYTLRYAPPTTSSLVEHIGYLWPYPLVLLPALAGVRRLAGLLAGLIAIVAGGYFLIIAVDSSFHQETGQWLTFIGILLVHLGLLVAGGVELIRQRPQLALGIRRATLAVLTTTALWGWAATWLEERYAQAAEELARKAPAAAARAQTPKEFSICVPERERAGRDVGCFVLTEQPLGTLERPRAFWHVTRFTSRASAERENSTAAVKSSLVEAFGTPWLLTITDSSWRARTGHQVAVIGPLPIETSVSYTAMYMEASMRPGMRTPVHRHAGPEAWYTLAGETCLETRYGKQVDKPGNRPVIVPGGWPMELTATGTTLRKSLVLILRDASQPATVMDSSWTPIGLCQSG